MYVRCVYVYVCVYMLTCRISTQTTPFKVFGVPLSDKAFVYVLALQVSNMCM